MRRLRHKCIREGGVFLAVGVGDNVFACKSMFLVLCIYFILCLKYENYFRSTML